MLMNGSIDDLEAAVNFGCLSLSQEISRLRKTGMHIQQSVVTRKIRTKEGVSDKSVSSYRLTDNLIVHTSSLRVLFVVGLQPFILNVVDNQEVPDLVRHLREVADKLEEINCEER